MIVAGEVTRKALTAHADKTLIHDLSGRSRTGRQIRDTVDRLAGALIERGLAGAKVGLWYWNGAPAIEAFLAAEWIGGTRVPVDPGAPVVEARAVFDAAGTDIVLTDRAHEESFGGRGLVHDWDEPLEGNPVWPAAAVDPDHPFLLYPRAVNKGRLFAIPVSYRNWDATMRANISHFRAGRYGDWLGENELFLSAQQIMHGTGFLGTFPFLAMGVPQVVVEKFDAEGIVDAIQKYNATAMMVVPVMLTKLIDAAERRPRAVASLRHVLYGGGPVTADEMRRGWRCLGECLVQVYGRVEGGWPITVLGIEDHRAIFQGNDELGASCGRPVGDIEIQLRRLSEGGTDRGELRVRGDMVVRDYIDPDGWCSLGDIMRIDGEGYCFYQGRLDRMINTGYHVYPAEIEEAVSRVAGVAAVRVVGEPHADWGETVAAYIVPVSGQASDALVETIRREMIDQLAKYKIPRVFHIVKELPPA